MDFNRYFTNADLESSLREWAAAYPKILKLTQLGKSYEKRPIWLLTTHQPAQRGTIPKSPPSGSMPTSTPPRSPGRPQR